MANLIRLPESEPKPLARPREQRRPRYDFHVGQHTLEGRVGDLLPDQPALSIKITRENAHPALWQHTFTAAELDDWRRDTPWSRAQVLATLREVAFEAQATFIHQFKSGEADKIAPWLPLRTIGKLRYPNGCEEPYARSPEWAKRGGAVRRSRT